MERGMQRVQYRVRYIGTDDDQVAWGSNDDPRKFLIEGEVYNVYQKDVRSMHTKLYLVEFPGKRFNSVSFKELGE